MTNYLTTDDQYFTQHNGSDRQEVVAEATDSQEAFDFDGQSSDENDATENEEDDPSHNEELTEEDA